MKTRKIFVLGMIATNFYAGGITLCCSYDESYSPSCDQYMYVNQDNIIDPLPLDLANSTISTSVTSISSTASLSSVSTTTTL